MKIESLHKNSSNLLFPILLGLSILVFWRGHHLPGGGFIAGLIAALALVLKQSSQSESSNSKILEWFKYGLPVGLSLAFLAAMMGLVFNQSLLSAVWLPEVNLPGLKLHLGSPILFDLGVFITVTTFCICTVQYYKEVE